MPIYTLLTTGINQSQLITQLELRHEAMRSIERGTTQPTVVVTGAQWERTNEPGLGNAIKRYNGSTYELLMDPDFAQINRGGTIAFAANQAMGTFKLTGLGAGSVAGDSVRFEQVLLLTGGTMSGNIAMGNNRVTGMADPIAGEDAARKFFVEARAALQGSGTWDPSVGGLTVDLGPTGRPRAVLASIEQMNPSAPSAHSTPLSTAALFVAGTGTEAGRVIHGGTTSPHNTPTFETLNCGFTDTSFTLQVGSITWRYVRVRYQVWRNRF